LDLRTGHVWTDGVARLFGLRADPVPSTLQSWEQHIEPDDLANARRLIAAATERRLSNVDCEYRVVSTDGSTRWLTARGKLSYGTDDKPSRLVGVTVDITDRKRAEEMLRDNAVQLRLADSRKDEFLAALAHELRNPLAPIRSAGAVIRPGMSADTISWCHDVIERQTAHLTRLVDDLLDVSRISHGKLALRKERVELERVVNNAIEITRPVLDRRSLTIDVALPTEGVISEADPVRLTQVFANLLTNAAKFSHVGAPLRISGERYGDEVVVSVIDQGIGIPKEALAHVFDIFSQGQPPIDRTESGLGLGLAIVRKLVELHAGTVEAHSSGRGHGSEFVVRLPLSPTRASEAGIGNRPTRLAGP
jgi:PAS domain S-box-containing protein